MPPLTDKQIAFIKEPNHAVVSTIDGRGRPHATVVWVDTDGKDVLFNTRTTRAKARHLAQSPHVSVLVIDRADPHRWVEVRGVAETTEEGALEHIHKLARKYGGEEYVEPWDRLVVRVRPERVNGFGV
jgi:PPOX class probable F420-dependent enzyme